MTWCELYYNACYHLYAAIDKYKIPFVQQIFIFVFNMYPVFKLPGLARLDHIYVINSKFFGSQNHKKKQMTKSVGRGITCRCNKRT